MLCKGGFLFTHNPIEILHVIAETDLRTIVFETFLLKKSACGQV